MDSNSAISIKTTLPLNYNPQANEFIFEEDNIKFNSKFDSGNLFNAQRTEPFTVIKKIKKIKIQYKLQISSDCLGIQQEFSYRTWFYFSIINTGETEIEVDLTFTNYSNQANLYNKGYKFIFREEPADFQMDEKYEEGEEFKWMRFKGEITNKVIYINKQLRDEKNLELNFKPQLKNNKKYFFAFCYPWSYLKNMVKIKFNIFNKI